MVSSAYDFYFFTKIFFLLIYLYSASRYSLIENFVLSSIGIYMMPLYTISSEGSWKSFKYGCDRACSAVNLSFGLKTRSLAIRSRASGSIFPKNPENPFFLLMLIWFRHYFAITDYIESISLWVGLPKSSRILYIWFRVELPGKTDFPVYIYAKIHPTDHISTAFV